MSKTYKAAVAEFRSRVTPGTQGYIYRYTGSQKWSWCTVCSPMAGPCVVALGVGKNALAPVYDNNGGYLRDSKGSTITITDVTCITA